MIFALLVFGSTAASAAVPPLKMAKLRQQALRSEAAKTKVDVSVTVIAGNLASYAKSGVGLGGRKAVELAATDSDGVLTLGAEASLPWAVIYTLLVAPKPIGTLQRHIGNIDTSRATIQTLEDDFVYVWGGSPELAISRNLALIRRITVASGEHTWEFRLSGDLGVSGLPTRIHVLRSGEPYATVGLSKTLPE